MKWRSRPSAAARPAIDVREHPRDRLDLAEIARLLLELAEDRAVRMLAELDPATGQRPGADVDLEDRQPGEEDPAVVVRAERIAPEAGPARRRGLRDLAGLGHGRSSPARKRGSRAVEAGTRSPITRPMVSRTVGRSASRRAA